MNKNKFKNIPIGIGGISLGFLSLSNIWDSMGFSLLRLLAVIFAITNLTLIFLKVINNKKDFKSILNDPFAGSLFFTCYMAMFLIGAYFAKYNLFLGQIIWSTGLILYLINFIYFLKVNLTNFKLEKLLVSWFVPAIGIGVSAITSRSVHFDQLGIIIFWYAFSWFVILVPVMVYRVFIFKPHIPEHTKFSLAIFAAPNSVILASYLSVYDQYNIYLLAFLGVLALVGTFFVYTLIPTFLKVDFTFGFAPLTFPLAISAVAMQKVAIYFERSDRQLTQVLNQIFFIEFIIATLVIGYIVFQTLVVASTYLKERGAR